MLKALKAMPSGFISSDMRPGAWAEAQSSLWENSPADLELMLHARTSKSYWALFLGVFYANAYALLG
jgi:hypothetical protein